VVGSLLAGSQSVRIARLPDGVRLSGNKERRSWIRDKKRGLYRRSWSHPKSVRVTTMDVRLRYDGAG